MPDREILSRLYEGVDAPPVKYVTVRPSWFEKLILVLAMLMVGVMILSLVYLSSLGSGNRSRLDRNRAIACYSLQQEGRALPPECSS